MSYKFYGNTYQPEGPGLVLGNYTNPSAAMASWSYDNPATITNAPVADLNLNIAETLPANLFASTGSDPGFAAKMRDFNSQYGSTITGGLQAAAGLWGSYNGMQQNKLVKQQMANSLNQWNKNYANQVASYNTRLEDRHRAAVAAQGANQPDMESYMAKNRLK